MALNKVLKVNSDSELLSFIINSQPILQSNVDLPVQGQDIKPIGQLILGNQQYKNAFINAVNQIGLTIISRNYWENPWENFINRGVLSIGSSVREMAVDIAPVFDYNEFVENPTHFLQNVVPNVYQYIHELNFQKFYKVTTSDEQMAMAFTQPNGLFTLIEEIVGSLYEGYKYDTYIVNKYMLCRRIVDGTVTSVEIPNYNTLDARDRVAFMKNISNLMTFMSPNYNPTGLRRSTPFDRQIMIMNTDFSATLDTNVLATSFFRDSAEFKTRSALIDGFGNHDNARLIELLGSAYIPFTADELTQLKNVPATIIDEEWFQNYNYALDTSSADMLDGSVVQDMTRGGSFFNPESLRNNHWLHSWKVISSSPFRQCVCFVVGETPAVTSVTISPNESTVSAGLTVQLNAEVVTTGFANKAVVWSVTEASGEKEGGGKVTVDALTGLVSVPSDYTPTSTEDANPIVITATSVFDSTKSNTATISVV